MPTIEDLRSCVDRLPVDSRQFAQSLISSFERYGSLTPKQAPWVERLVQRANRPQVKPVEIGNMSGIMALFDRAKAHLQFPAIVLHVAELNRAVRINVAGGRARFPGSLNVTSTERGDDDRRAWFGRIHKHGRYECAQAIAGTDEAKAIAVQLARFAADPAGVATEHGRLTGHCCFCNIKLKDKRSTAVGYGRTCAEHYGLPWGADKSQF